MGFQLGTSKVSEAWTKSLENVIKNLFRRYVIFDAVLPVTVLGLSSIFTEAIYWLSEIQTRMKMASYMSFSIE